MEDRRKLTVHSVLQLNTPPGQTFFNGSPPNYPHHILFYFILLFSLFVSFIFFNYSLTLLSYIHMIALNAHDSIDHCPYAVSEATIGTVLCDLIRKFETSYQLCAKTMRGKKLIKKI